MKHRSQRITTFYVKGTPIPKGSANAFRHKSTDRIIVTQSGGVKQKKWAKRIAEEAFLSTHMHFDPEAPKIVEVEYFMPRPRYHYRKDGSLRQEFISACHTVKPDVDKLDRCVLDALDEKFYVGDQKVVTVRGSKQYANGNPGALITVREVLPPDVPQEEDLP